MTNTTARPFTLYGGPHDGRPLVVETCRHGNWPDLQPEGNTKGIYRYDEATDTYRWVEL